MATRSETEKAAGGGPAAGLGAPVGAQLHCPGGGGEMTEEQAGQVGSNNRDPLQGG